MPMQVQLAIRSNVHPATVRRIQSDAALIADGLGFLTVHQAVHIRPHHAAALARAAARRGRAAEDAARAVGGGL